ncbi:alanine--glyoxylate aminotransferase family protein [Verrucomicrobia bacterium]|nr:alanine--glyoxylate aminotransferase family protein [Verrucomicrobiota bacterium]
MTNQLESIREVLLMGPGPSCVFPEVYTALSRPTVGHLDPNFIKLMDSIKALQQQVMETTNALTIPMSGTGSAGMETIFVNLVEPEDNVLIISNGVFGGRMADVAGRLRANVDVVDFEWGTPVTTDKVAEALTAKTYKIVAIVHAETSTGVANPVEAVGKLVKEHGALYFVDAVTSLGGMPLKVDKWGIDALYSGTQKCLSCPPGISPVTLSARAVEKLKSRSGKVPNWYLDLTMIVNYWEGAKRAYHHTAPINMLYAFYQSLFNIVEEGLEATQARHAAMHEKLVEGLAGLGLEMLVPPNCRLPMLNAVKVPEGVDEAAVRSKLLSDHQIEIGAGLGPLAGKIWRIGLMGHTARQENVDRLIAALRNALA